MDKILVVIPAFNEADSLINILPQFKDYSYDVLVVDDGSNDKTKEVLLSSNTNHISHNKNMGQGCHLDDRYELCQ